VCECMCVSACVCVCVCRVGERGGVCVKSSQVKMIFIEGKRLRVYNFFYPALTKKENQEN